MASLLSFSSLARIIILTTLFAPLITAQGAPNVTLEFFTAESPNCGQDQNSASTLSFTTRYYPPKGVGICINLDEIFNSTSDIFNTTTIADTEAMRDQPVQVPYYVSNLQNWDPAANYTNVFYRQLDFDDSHDVDDEHYFAQRDVVYYYGTDCSQGVMDDHVVPWYTSSCRSRGDCQALPVPVRSFEIYRPNKTDDDGGNYRDKRNKCAVAAEYGAAASVRPAMEGMGLLAVAVAISQLA